MVENDVTPGIIMCFDYGTQRIGVAIGQRLTRTATPLAVLPAKDGIPKWDDLGKLITEWQPVYLVVGLPLNMDGSESDISIRAEKFARRLTGRFNLPAEMMDERLTSFEVRHRQKENGSVSKEPIDALAAQLILESWFGSGKT